VGFALIAYRYLVLLLTEFAGLFGDSEAQ